MRTLTEDNRVVHSLWIGKQMSKLELLTLRSFLEQGHEFHLWVYDEIETEIPACVLLQDADKVLPRERIFKKRGWDSESGLGRGSYGPFSDLFRYKLLYEKGGIWTDMDVTCLKPLDFEAEYLFRSHRGGVVGNLIKCPRCSQLMLDTYQAAEHAVNPNSPCLTANRILSENVNRLGLSGFVRTDICNQDSWWYAVRPLMEQEAHLPATWYFIHWINEFWRTLKETNGHFRGKRLLDYIPDKDRVRAGTTLARLYEKYGLFDPDLCPSAVASHLRSSATLSSEVVKVEQVSRVSSPLLHPEMPLNRPAVTQPIVPQIRPDPHLNILITSMALGGAERIVYEILEGLIPRNVTSKLFIMYHANPSYPVQETERMRVFWLREVHETRRMLTVALEVLASPDAILYTHMVPVRYLRQLWSLGVRTIPVIHNSMPSWQDSVDAFDDPNVPFVVAVSDAVAEQVRAEGCPKPVITIRHELQRWFTPDELQANRIRVRREHGIPDDTILIGMVGQFKLQKAYTRAARVLQRVQETYPAKLMILGGWDHEHGAGRAAYTAFCRQALELGVMPDVITPGAVNPVEPYYAAFDIFLNTSMYEGLSVAMLEAIHCGCPVVTADAGGNREALSPTSALVEDASDIDAYVDAIWPLLAQSQRAIPRQPRDADLVPHLWRLMARYGVPQRQEQSLDRSGTLFVTYNLNIGGAQRSLVNLIRSLAPRHRSALCIIDRVFCAEFLETVEQAGIPAFSVQDVSGTLDRTERILHMIESLNVRNVCFWNADAQTKLLLAKVLQERAIRLIDVSPGPMLFDELSRTDTFQRRISLTDAQYFRRLDRFVAKYERGGVSPCLVDVREKTVVIPNGVPEFTGPLTPESDLLPAGVDPDFVVGTCCRIVPSKRVGFLIEIMAHLTALVPQASLILVGGVDPRRVAYWHEVVTKLQAAGLNNVHFVGPKADVRPYLQLFKVFVMISDEQGCPNASLEAMMMGLPVVANANGGTSEQIRNGMNGFLVSDIDPADAARRIALLLTDARKRNDFGKAAGRIARSNFSMERMTERYLALFEETDK